MSKFYVQCGPIQAIFEADSVEQAALSGLDRTLQAHLWIYDDPGLSEQDRRNHLMLEALMHLDPVVRISEQRDDGDTPGVASNLEYQLAVIFPLVRPPIVVANPANRSDL